MRCLNPVVMSFNGYKPDGKPRLAYGAGKGLSDDHPLNSVVGCGKCEPCKITKGEELATRIIAEAATSSFAYFLTLTYDPEHMPSDGKISKAHGKEFRDALARSFPGVRTLIVGEYGTRTKRPHYHPAIFGVDLHPVLQQYTFDSAGEPRYISERLAAIWGRGHVEVSEMNIGRAHYLGNHAIKAVGSDSFVQTPRLPALGDVFRRAYWDDFARLGHFHFEGRTLRIPQAWKNATPDDRYHTVKERAKAYALRLDAALLAAGRDPRDAAEAALANRLAQLGLKRQII